MAAQNLLHLYVILFFIKCIVSTLVFLRQGKQNSLVGRRFALFWYFITQISHFSRYA